jgi:hypothetical protein
VLRIVSSIYATEAVHYAIFRDSLNGITEFQNGTNLVVPDLTEGRQGSSHVFPRRCTFLSEQLPTCSVIRPSSTRLAGAQATVTALAASNPFKGRPAGQRQPLAGPRLRLGLPAGARQLESRLWCGPLGGIGRRTGLKIPSPQGRAGSSPAAGTST